MALDHLGNDVAEQSPIGDVCHGQEQGGPENTSTTHTR